MFSPQADIECVSSRQKKLTGEKQLSYIFKTYMKQLDLMLMMLNDRRTCADTDKCLDLAMVIRNEILNFNSTFPSAFLISSVLEIENQMMIFF